MSHDDARQQPGWREWRFTFSQTLSEFRDALARLCEDVRTMTPEERKRVTARVVEDDLILTLEE